jgi:hypothetical protein
VSAGKGAAARRCIVFMAQPFSPVPQFVISETEL